MFLGFRHSGIFNVLKICCNNKAKSSLFLTNVNSQGFVFLHTLLEIHFGSRGHIWSTKYSVSSRTKLSTFIGQNFKFDVHKIFQLGMINYHLNSPMKPKKVILTRGHSPVTEILDFD